MKAKLLLLLAPWFTASFVIGTPLGTAFTYQGRLTDGGVSAQGIYDLRFSLHDAVIGGSQFEIVQTNSATSVNNGLFAVTLDFGPGVFADAARWLEIAVRTNGAAGFVTLSPRQPLMPSPYALYAPSAGLASHATSASVVLAGGVSGASLQGNAVTTEKIANGAVEQSDLSAGVLSNTFWRLDGNAGTTPDIQFLGTTDTRPVKLRVNNQQALRLEWITNVFGVAGAVNVIFGPVNWVADGIVGATISGGGAISTDQNNYTNSISADFGTIGGGHANSIQPVALGSTIAGGLQNSIGPLAFCSTLGGGLGNAIHGNNGDYSGYSTIGGGYGNNVSENTFAAIIGGGHENTIQNNASYGTVGGGFRNRIRDHAGAATIGGGYGNNVGENTFAATIGGGCENTIQTDALYGAVVGGSGNVIQDDAAWSVIGGGSSNLITINAKFAAIPGGKLNSAGADHALAAGYRAKAVHAGTFVWADSSEADFASTTTNQFSIRAAGGVRLETGGLGVALDGQPVLSGLVQAGQLGSDVVTGAEIADGAIAAADLSPALASNTFWRLGGNAGINPGANFLGTTDSQPLELQVNGARAFRLEPTTSAPNVIGGWSGNYAALGVVGAAIAGGGNPSTPSSNRITGSWSFIGGGTANEIGALRSVIAGGVANVIEGGGSGSSIGGGAQNLIQTNALYVHIGGGYHGTIGTNAHWATIGGGSSNTVGTAARFATIPGGQLNAANAEHTLAAGRRAQANHPGAFVWADSTDADMVSTRSNQFLIRASSGVGIGTNSPQSALHVAGTVTADGFTGSGAGLTSLNGGALAPGSVSNSVLAVNAVTTDKIEDETVADADINGVTGISGTKIIGGDLQADRLKVGFGHTLTGVKATIAGGNNNTASNYCATVGGGDGNMVSGSSATVSGGWQNAARGDGAFIGGGGANMVTSSSATIGGGYGNVAGGMNSTVAGGYQNIASGSGAFVGGGGYGGVGNIASGGAATIGGGAGNTSSADYSSVCGGNNNTASNYCATVGGGDGNMVSGSSATVSGGWQNAARGDGAFIGGGGANMVTSSSATIGGGYGNIAGGMNSTVAGGYQNIASGSGAFVGGGGYGGVGNIASGGAATIGGGAGNTSSADYSAVCGGNKNSASNYCATVGGGYGNTASGSSATVGGGGQNIARGDGAFIGGGGANMVTNSSATIGGGYGNIAGGVNSTVPGGYYNAAIANCSFAAGFYAQATNAGAFVWSDYSTNSFFSSSTSNQFNIRSAGGVRIATTSSGTVGVQLTAGATSWTTLSDRNAKKNFQPMDPVAVLEKLATITIEQWNYTWEQDGDVPHFGPMAQDFKAAFYPGRDDKGISTLEFDGVELAAIQGLNQKVEGGKQRAEIQIGELKAENAELKARLEKLEQLVEHMLIGGEK